MELRLLLFNIDFTHLLFLTHNVIIVQLRTKVIYRPMSNHCGLLRNWDITLLLLLLLNLHLLQMLVTNVIVQLGLPVNVLLVPIYVIHVPKFAIASVLYRLIAVIHYN
jgi:hypothetical protein